MAKLDYKDEQSHDAAVIAEALGNVGIPFVHWGKPVESGLAESEILDFYYKDINKLKAEGGYVTADVVCLDQDTPNLEELCAKFVKEHHHDEDEVRFVVEGEGIFEIDDGHGHFAKLVTEAGDLVVVPQGRRHKFYLTDTKKIRCIRLFKSQEGWQAIY